MGKTSTASKRKYNEKAYDRISLTVPKGMKDVIKALAASRGKPVNSLIWDLLRKELDGFDYEKPDSDE